MLHSCVCSHQVRVLFRVTQGKLGGSRDANSAGVRATEGCGGTSYPLHDAGPLPCFASCLHTCHYHVDPLHISLNRIADEVSHCTLHMSSLGNTFTLANHVGKAFSLLGCSLPRGALQLGWKAVWA